MFIKSAEFGPRTSNLLQINQSRYAKKGWNAIGRSFRRDVFLISPVDSYANKYALYGSKRWRVRSCFRCNPKLSGLRDQRRINRPSENRLEISCVRAGRETERGQTARRREHDKRERTTKEDESESGRAPGKRTTKIERSSGSGGRERKKHPVRAIEEGV